MKAAQTAWNQISMGCKMACGARKATAASDTELRFRVERRPYRFISVILDEGRDLYIVEYYRLKRGSFQKVSIQKADGVFCDQLSETIYHMVNR